MSPVSALLLALAVGVVVGAAVMAVVNWGLNARRRLRERPPLLDPEVVTVVAALYTPALVLGPHDEVLCANAPARTIGLVRGRRVRFSSVLDQMRRARESGLATTVELRQETGPGAPARMLTSRVHPLERQTVLAIVADHSALLRADESKRDLVANVSHELKTPVGAMQVLAETLQQGADDPDVVRHFAARMDAEATRLAELVGQMIELSRLQSDDPLMGAHVVPIDEVVDQAGARTQDVRAARDIAYSVAGDKGLEVIGDQSQLVSALTNLVTNAIAYSDPGARVVVTVRATTAQDSDMSSQGAVGSSQGAYGANDPGAHDPASLREAADDPWVEIAVTDNGIGIAPEEQERVFERFYRVDFARSRADGGTGLGLSIVKHVVAAHGGTVGLWSKPGQGSTFTIRLPRNPSMSEEA